MISKSPSDLPMTKAELTHRSHEHGYLLEQELKLAGFQHREVRTKPSPTPNRTTPTLAQELKLAGFSGAELRSAGFTPKELLTVGLTKGDIKAT